MATAARTTAARKAPQDRKPKAPALKPGQFVGLDGETYTLPDPGESLNLATGRDLRNIALGDDGEQLAVQFKILEKSDVDEQTLDALYDLPLMDAARVIGEWIAGTDLPNG